MSEYEMLLEKINKNKDIELNEIDRTEIDDIRNIKINKNLPVQERIVDFLKKVKNPYVFKVDGHLVRIEFTENVKTAEGCLTNVLANLYR